MRPATNPHRELRGRRTYAVATLLYALFVIYGSLVPLEFQPMPLDQAFERFSEIFVLPLPVDSRTDVVTNILLFIPLGFLLLGTLRADRRGHGGLPAGFFVSIICGALSVGIEFTQIFFRGRTVALSDMVAESAGGIIGVALWLVSGKAMTAWTRALSVERERPASIQRLLLVYCVGWFVSQILPLDLTLGLGELAHKYRSGRIILVPFGYTHESWFTAAWDYLTDIALNVPLGAAAALLWSPVGARRRWWVAFGWGVAAVSFIELAQLFVYSRFADVTDIVTGSVGVALGVAAASALSDRRQATTVRKRAAGGAVARARMAIAVWTGVLVSYHWRPFDFTVEPDRVTAGLHELLSVPFSWYYAGTEFHAFTEMSRKSLLAVPLGVLLRLAWPDDRRWPTSRLRLVVLAGLGFCLLFGIEVGQVFLPDRVPDVTDAIMGELGVVAGLWLAGLFAVPLPDRAPLSDRAPLPDRAEAARPPLGVTAPVADRPRRFTFVSVEEPNHRKGHQGPQGRPGRPAS